MPETGIQPSVASPLFDRDDEGSVDDDSNIDNNGNNASHYDDDDDDNSNYEEPEGDHDGDNREEISSSVMREYLQSIQKQIRDEGNTKRTEEVVDRWIIEYLKVNDFYLHSQMSSYICGRLGIQHAIDGYYKSVLVWLPDLQFDCLPPCPCCGYSNRVGVHGYEGKTLARSCLNINNVSQCNWWFPSSLEQWIQVVYFLFIS